MTDLLVDEELLFKCEEDGHYGFESEISEIDEQKDSNERFALKATVRDCFINQINSCVDTCHTVHIDSVVEELDSLMSQTQIRFVEFQNLEFCLFLEFNYFKYLKI